ncbi:hypothetical protein AB6A40_010527 [Gnathostoma spinigerum]|uniref:Uncharacterized protein n=1 Tax=Gnathostoma spinigerum TaxID=75299 RepID=A0ABD6F1W9_9BILA
MVDVWKVVRKNMHNDALIKYMNKFRSYQIKMNQAVKSIFNDDFGKLQQLLDPVLVGCRNSDGRCLLHVAVIAENHEVVEYIANEYPHQIDQLDKAGRSPLHYAAVQKNTIYETLIEYGADMDITDESGYTAQFYRIYPEFLDAVNVAAIPSAFSASNMPPDNQKSLDPGQFLK